MTSIISGERQISYSDIHARIARAAAGFRALGLSGGVPVGMMLRNDFALFEASAVEPRSVQERAVRRPEVLHPHSVLTRLEAGVARGRVFVGRDRDVVLIPATDRELRRVELVVFAGGEVGALDDDEPPGGRPRPRDLHAGAAPGWGEHEALLWQTEIAARGADDPPDEHVEQDEERDLEDEQDLVDSRGVEDHWPLFGR